MFLEDLFPELEIYVPAVMDEVYLLALQHGSRKFFRESEVWCVPLDTVPVGANVNEIEIDVPSDTSIHAVHSVSIKGDELNPASFSVVSALKSSKGAPSDWYRQGVKMHLAPTPVVGFELAVLGVLVPVRQHIEIAADEYAEKYSDTIVAAAAYYLSTMPNKPWTNMRAALTYKATYEEGRLIARREALGYLDKRSNIMNSSNVRRTSDY